MPKLIATRPDGSLAPAGFAVPDVLMTPDYANMETVNRITVNDGTWTVDRAGFVQCKGNSHGSGVENAAVYINEKMVSFVGSGRSGDGTFTNNMVTNVATLPVVAGDVVRIHVENTPAPEADATPISCYFIPPKFASVAEPVVSEDWMNVAMVPDYANAETVNRIPKETLASNTNSKFGSWTADRTGYVNCILYALSDAAHVSLVISINGKYMYVSGKDGPVNMTSYYSNTVPVKTGDVVTFIFGSGENANITVGQSGCYFIPPKFITVQATNIVISGASYSTAEQATGEGWLDGKPVYRKVFEGGITASANAESSVVLFSGISSFIKGGGVWKQGDGDVGYDIVGSGASKFWITTSNELVLQTRSSNGRANAPYKVWVEYTKI
jgi:hypothetical protein